MSADPAQARPLTVAIWILVIAALLIGGYKLTHPGHRSHDQQIVIDKSK